MTEIRFNDFGETDYLTVYNWMQNQRINISLNKSLIVLLYLYLNKF